MVDILARLKIRAEEFSRGADAAFGRFEQQASQAGNRAGDEFARGLSARLDALSAGAGVAAVVAVGQRALEHVTTLKKESQQLGISTKALQEYRFAASEVGVEQDALSDSFTDLTQKIGEARGGNKEAMEAFRDLGIDIDTTTGRAKSMEAVFNELIGRLSMVSDPTERARLEAQLFGEEWRKIDPMLRAGSGRIDQLRNAAHEFGAVISDDAIQNADATARKVAQMKMVLEANIADAVARNSTAILGMANSLTTMAGSLAQWWSQNPEKAYALMGAAGGARAGFFVGGPIGALVGAGGGLVAGAVYGKNDKQAADDANTDLAFRRQQLMNAKKERDAMRAAQSSNKVVSLRRSGSDRSGATLAQADAELLRQAKLLWRASQPKASTPSGPINMPWAKGPRLDETSDTAAGKGAGASGGKSNGKAGGKSDAEREAEKQIEAEKRLRESLQETIQSQRDSDQVAALRAQGLERQADLQQAMLEIQRQFPGLEGTTNAEAAKSLGIREEQVAPLREQYELLKAIRTAEVNRDNDAAEVKARVETERKAQEEIQRLRDAADDRQRRSVEDLSRYYYDLFSGHGGDIWRDFKREGMEVISVLAAQWTIAMMTGQKFDPATALGSAGMGGYGGPVSSLASALFNGRGRSDSLAELVAKEGGDADQIRSAAAMGKSLGSTTKELGSLNKYLAGIGAGQAVSGLAGAVGLRQSSTGALAGSAIGTAIGGPLGGAIGGLVAGTLGGLLKKTKKGSASINIVDGAAAVGDAYGNSSSYRTNATALGGSVADQLNSIADMLGGDLTGTGAVSIGQRKKKFVVDTSGTRKTKGAGTLSFDTEEAAVEAAVRDMLQDGILGGVSAASQKILRDSGQTLEKALTKASLIEAIPDALQARLNPVQYAMDQLNEKWDDTWAALKEGAATAEQMAQAQQLYNLELEEVKNTTAGAAQGLKDFIKSMDMGSSSPLSLRDQDKAAYDALSPYLAQINAGQSINQDAYMDAAQTWLDIQRQLYGSTAKYFESFDTIQSATAAAIADIESVTSITTASDAFNQTTAKATEAMAADTSNMVTLMQQQIDYLQQLIAAQSGSSGSTFTGSTRNY